LGIHGKAGFQYPELALFDALILLVSFIPIERALKTTRGIDSYIEENLEIALQEIGGNEEGNALEVEEIIKQRERYLELKKIYKLRRLI
jgi:hypothetical protein